MMFEAKVIGVLQTSFNWDITEPMTAFKHFYRTPLKTLCKTIKAKGGNEYDVAIYFLLAATKSEFEVDGYINLRSRLTMIPSVAHEARFGDVLRQEALEIQMNV